MFLQKSVSSCPWISKNYYIITRVKQFPELFDVLDNQKDELRIQSYGISITTMEEVFLRVAHLGDDVDVNQALKNEKLKNQPSMLEDTEIDNFDLNQVRVKNPTSLFYMHFIALFLKRVRFFRRDLKGLICEIFLPCLVVIGGLSILLI